MTSAFCFLLGNTHGVPPVIQVHQVRPLKNTLIHSVTCFCGSAHWKYNLTHTVKTTVIAQATFTSKYSSGMHVVLSPSFHWTCLGDPGKDGTDGVPGVDGTDGVPGDNGTDGVPGVNGTDGVPGSKGR